MATRAAEYRSECAARAMRQRDPREAEAARAAYPAAEAEAEAARALKAGYEAARLGGRSIRIGSRSNPARPDVPFAASSVEYPNSWFLPRESDDEMVARDPRWRQKNYTYDAGVRVARRAVRLPVRRALHAEGDLFERKGLHFMQKRCVRLRASRGPVPLPELCTTSRGSER